MSAATAEEPTVITQPGVVLGMPHETYLADPVQGGSLSHSGVKTLVNKTPAVFAYEREHGRPNKAAFNFGHAAHQIVLGVGPDIIIVQADNWMTKAAKAERDEAYLRGAVPILAREHEVVVEMAKAISAHPLASKLLAAGSGQPEASAFVQDPASGIWLRCRYDFLREPGSSGRLLLVDYKTCDDASDEAFGRAAMNFGYHIQDYFYSHIAKLLGLAEDIAFLFIAQEKTPPYLVNVVALDVLARRIGAHLSREAIDTYRDCTAADVWPGYPAEEPALVSLPPYYERRYEDQLI